MPYKDDGNPSNYIFVVDDYSEPDHPTVMFTPVLYWKQEQSQSDWELNISIPWLSELMESTYEILWSVPGGPKTPQEAHDLLVAAGYVYSPAFAKAAGVYGNGSVVTKATKPKTAKLSTEFFKKHIVTNLANDPVFSEIMNAYGSNEPEYASMRNPKKWKRAFKRKGTLKSLESEEITETHYGHVFMSIYDYLLGERYIQMVVYDQVHMSNHSNVVTVREFVWTDCPDEDTTISFITDESDTRMVAICYHID